MNACNGFFTLHLGAAYKVLPVPEGFSITAGIFSILENELSPFSFWNFLRFWSGTFSISIIEQTVQQERNRDLSVSAVRAALVNP